MLLLLRIVMSTVITIIIAVHDLLFSPKTIDRAIIIIIRRDFVGHTRATLDDA